MADLLEFADSIRDILELLDRATIEAGELSGEGEPEIAPSAGWRDMVAMAEALSAARESISSAMSAEIVSAVEAERDYFDSHDRS